MFEIFPTFLSTASTAAAKKGGKIVLILDAVNQVCFGFGCPWREQVLCVTASFALSITRRA